GAGQRHPEPGDRRRAAPRPGLPGPRGRDGARPPRQGGADPVAPRGVSSRAGEGPGDGPPDPALPAGHGGHRVAKRGDHRRHTQADGSAAERPDLAGYASRKWGMTSRAKSSIDRRILSWGRPPKFIQHSTWPTPMSRMDWMWRATVSGEPKASVSATRPPHPPLFHPPPPPPHPPPTRPRP